MALASAGFVVGVAVALLVQVSFLWSLLAFIFLTAGLLVARAYALPVIILAAAVVGAGFGSAHLAEREAYAAYVGLVVKVKGRVKEDPSRNASGATSLQLEAVELNDNTMAGSVFVSVRSVKDVKRGDFVVGVGEAREGFAHFPITFSLVRLESVTRSKWGDVGRVVRDWFADKVRQVVPEPQASLGIGFLTGQKSALPTDLSESLKVAGLTHIVVASGYNLTILVQMARRVFIKASKYLSAISAGVMILSFMAVTGLSPSMARAGLVSGMSLLSWYYGHSFHPFVLLPLAAALTALSQPSYVWGDLGWQLSFSAFVGVMIVAPLFQNYFFGSSPPSTVRQILGETLAAHAVTVPVIALSFGVISNVAIVANLLVVPLVPLAMLLTFLCGLGVMLAVPFIELLATATSWLLGYMVNVATFVSEIPWAQSELASAPLVWAGYLLLVVSVSAWMWYKTKYDFRGG